MELKLMVKNFHTIVIKRKYLLFTFACLLASLGLVIFFIDHFTKSEHTYLPEHNSDYVILAANDTGMRCYQQDFSSYLLLPPGNTLKAQVFRKEGDEAELINSGIKVSYRLIDNTSSADKINFWQYAKDYGFDLQPNIGITGNGLSGEMKLSKDGNYYEVTAIPVTPYNDGSTELNPYQLATITVADISTGEELATVDNVVVPVSNEMECSICHGASDTDLNILKVHDELSGTNLVADLEKGKRYKCSDCHRDDISEEAGMPGELSLSQAMHGFHADEMTQSNIEPQCYSCHPGPVSQCYRGVMYANGVSCQDTRCHGDMANVAQTQAEGRQAWLQEADCGNCHGDKYKVNPGQLYRNSYLINNANPEMNGIILCESCHNSPHAEWPSTNPKDNLLPGQLLGYPSFIDQCTVCHEGTGTIHQITP